MCKTCPLCKTEKPAGGFYADKAKADGLSSYCRECRKSYQQARRQADPETQRARVRACYHKNPQPYKDAARRWAKQNPEYFVADMTLRRTAQRNLGEFDRFVLREAASLAKLRKEATGYKWEIDHVVAIRRGGDSSYTNIQVVPAVWNKQKGARHQNRLFPNQPR